MLIGSSIISPFRFHIHGWHTKPIFNIGSHLIRCYHNACIGITVGSMKNRRVIRHDFECLRLCTSLSCYYFRHHLCRRRWWQLFYDCFVAGMYNNGMCKRLFFRLKRNVSLHIDYNGSVSSAFYSHRLAVPITVHRVSANTFTRSFFV